MNAGDEGANTIRECRDLQGRPLRCESVHERSGESVTGADGVDDIHRMPLRFDVLAGDGHRTAASAQRHACRLPLVAFGTCATESFRVRGEVQTFVQEPKLSFVEFHDVGRLQQFVDEFG